MREIKFRAYDTHTKTMLPIVDIIKFTKSEGIYITRDSAYGVGINIQYQPHIELMQYTGIKDKNGKEIYEGDIVEWDGYTMEIFWGEDVGCGYGFCWRPCGSNTDYNESMTGFIDEYEVIRKHLR